MTSTLFAFGFPGPMEMVICGMVALLLFGGRLPKVANDIGRSVFELRKGLSDAFKEIEDEPEVIKKQRAPRKA